MKILGTLATLLASSLLVEAVPHPIYKSREALKRRTHDMLTERYSNDSSTGSGSGSGSGSCSHSPPDPATAPNANVWAQLTDDETDGVYGLLTDTFNLTAYSNATLYDNFVMWVETLRPNKTDALSYLDSNATAPPRYARAVLFFGGEDFAEDDHPDGYWETYQVGPLPVGDETVVQPLDWLNAKSKVDFKYGFQDDLRYLVYYKTIFDVFLNDSVRPVIEDITKSPTFGLDNSTLLVWMTDPLQYDEDANTLGTWSSVFGNNVYNASDILSHGLYFLTNLTGRDPAGHSIYKWFYDNTLYNSTDEFVDAWKSGDMTILPQGSSDTEWTFPSYVSGGRDLDDRQAPLPVEPDGRRWTYSEEDRYFTWMDWEFFTAWDRDRGLALYDVKFKGERILYELALQEAIAEYAGDDPFQMNTVYMDSAYGFGNEAWGLVPGYDCPYNAEFFNVSWHSMGEHNFQNNSYCAYEYLDDSPVSRHVASSYVTVTKNPTFVMRTVSTIRNYDYSFAYQFYLDGTIDVSVRAAGYIQGSYYNNETSEPFGYRIGETLSGSFHDHVLNFKVDLDVGGTVNQVRKVDFVKDTQEFPWAPGKEYYVKKRVPNLIESEDDSRLTWPANGAGALLVESADQVNAWGSPRAYRIMPGSSPVHRIVNESITVVNQAQWANHDVCFTQHKDSEPFSSNIFNAHDIHDPTVKFYDFFDGESLEGEDIVAWVNLGLHHLPNTQDIPITIFSTAKSNFVLTPFNYFDNVQITDVKSQAYYNYSSNDTSQRTWDFSGSDVKQCAVEIDPLSYSSFNYDGVAIASNETSS